MRFLAAYFEVRILIAICVGHVMLASLTYADERIEFFERKIRPLLAENCFPCHSHAATHLKAGLRVDHLDFLLAGGDSGPAIVPNKPADSLLMEAVNYESYEMPPQGKLSAEKIELLRQWIADGAVWPNEQPKQMAEAADQKFDWRQRKAAHWSWQPLQTVAPPDSVMSHPIDRFVDRALRQRSLTMSAPAERRTLIRRLYFDLIGLPPTIEEVQDYLQDDSPQAYLRVVERLLDSPRFGEKWARHWLDLMRYAESCGHEFDYPIPHAWRYRDYVIRAFNEDVPYDQFVREHIAGDLMDNPRLHPELQFNESILATGFWFLGEAVHGPTDVRGDEADRIDNALDVFSKSFLGLTVACARCHDHKFDPLPASDYYALSGYLQSSRRQLALLDPKRQIAEVTAKIHAERELVQSQLNDALRQAVPLEMDAIPTSAFEDPDIAESTHPLFTWKALRGASDAFADSRSELLAELESQQETAIEALSDSELFADFQNPEGWFVTGRALSPAGARATRCDGMLRLAAANSWDVHSGNANLVPPNVVDSGLLGRRQFGVLRSPTFTISHKHVHYRMRARQVDIRIIIDGFVMDEYNPLLFQDATLKGVDTSGKWIWKSQGGDLSMYVGHRAHLEIIDHGSGSFALDEVRFSNQSVLADSPSKVSLQMAQQVESVENLNQRYLQVCRESLQACVDGVPTAEHTQVVSWLVRHGLILDADTRQALSDQRARLQELDQRLPEPMLAVAMADGTAEDEHLFIRGDHGNLGEVVPRRFLVALSEGRQSADVGSGRLQLADEVTDPNNPFVSRVMVNRLWHHLLGRGIVPTVDDFGAMGRAPSHPELLDWLAADFIEGGWSIKRAIQQIVMSQTYRQSVVSKLPTDQIDQHDPENVFLHCARVRRLPAESVRDSLLSLTGRLDDSMYGPSVPVYLTSFMNGRGRPQESGPLDGDGRRSVYLEIRRNFLSPLMLAFDMPIPFSAMGRRSVSNVPAQSLIMMNHPLVHQQAKVMGDRLMELSGDDRDRVLHLFESALGRPPTEAQLGVVLKYVEQRRQHASRGEQEEPAVWADVCHIVFNMKEFIYLN